MAIISARCFVILETLNITFSHKTKKIVGEEQGKNKKQIAFNDEVDKYYYSKFLADGIAENVKKNILEEKKIVNLDCKVSECIKMLLTSQVYKYLIENSDINLDGYIKFRTSKIKELIKNDIELAQHKLNIKREYNDFINMLRYFVNTQSYQHKEITVIIDNNEDFIILDNGKNDITQKCIIDLLHYDESLDDFAIKSGDLLISSLIILAPKKICFIGWQNIKNKELKKTIEDVFQERIIWNNFTIT